MDYTIQTLTSLSKNYQEVKKMFLQSSERIRSNFNIPNDKKSSVDFGIIMTSDPSLQEFVDILNNNKTLINLNEKLNTLRYEGIFIILEYALRCNEEISGYDLNILLENPIMNQEEILILFEGLTGVHHIHNNNDKIMLEIPSREYVIQNKTLLMYVDFWARELEYDVTSSK